jgi:hypothetical protein
LETRDKENTTSKKRKSGTSQDNEYAENRKKGDTSGTENKLRM